MLRTGAVTSSPPSEERAEKGGDGPERALASTGPEGVAACADTISVLGCGGARELGYPFRPGVSLALDAGTPSPLFAPSSLGKEMGGNSFL